MYCGYCGAELRDEAVFCPSCGQRVAFDSAVLSSGPSVVQCASGNSPSGITEGSVETFASAMNRTKAKSRGRMQVIVLVALALMLLSSIAYAAYHVYTTYFAEPAPAVEQPAEGSVENERAYPWVIDSAVTYDGDGSLVKTSAYEYDERGRLVSISFNETDANPINGWSNGYLLSYDDAGRLVQELESPTEGVVTNEYDDSGRCVRRVNNEINQGYESFDTLFEFDDEGRLTNASGYSPSPAPEQGAPEWNRSVSFTYAQGALSGVSYVDRFSAIQGRETGGDGDYHFEYNESGQCIAASGIGTEMWTFIYDDFGNLVECSDRQGRTTYLTYRQIEVSRSSFIPTQYSNPSAAGVVLGGYSVESTGWSPLVPITLPDSEIERIMSPTSFAQES